jgi:hypothetical protein
MTIVVDKHDHACFGANLPVILKTPLDAFELRQRFGYRLVADLQFAGDGDRRERIANVVQPRQSETDMQGIFLSLSDDVESRPVRIEVNVLRTNIGVAVDTVGDDRASDMWQDFPNARIVRAQDGETVKRQVVQELDETSALFSRPPITKVGSSPPSASTLATRLVVVVLPCVPATAIE